MRDRHIVRWLQRCQRPSHSGSHAGRAGEGQGRFIEIPRGRPGQGLRRTGNARRSCDQARARRSVGSVSLACQAGPVSSGKRAGSRRNHDADVHGDARRRRSAGNWPEISDFYVQCRRPIPDLGLVGGRIGCDSKATLMITAG